MRTRRPARAKAKNIDGADALKRMTRTGLQGSAAVLIIIEGYNLFSPTKLTADQTQWATVAGTMLVSLVMNIIEELSGHSLLKASTEPQVEPVTTLTPEQMLATAEYLKAKALRESAEPRVFTVQETSPPRAGTAPPMPHVDIPPGGGRG